MKRRRVVSQGQLPARAFFDLPRGARGRGAGPLAAGGKVVILDPDVARFFGGSEDVNRALRALSEIVRRRARRIPGPETR